jgi:hypothetical protein
MPGTARGPAVARSLGTAPASPAWATRRRLSRLKKANSRSRRHHYIRPAGRLAPSETVCRSSGEHRGRAPADRELALSEYAEAARATQACSGSSPSRRLGTRYASWAPLRASAGPIELAGAHQSPASSPGRRRINSIGAAAWHQDIGQDEGARSAATAGTAAATRNGTEEGPLVDRDRGCRAFTGEALPPGARRSRRREQLRVVAGDPSAHRPSDPRGRLWCIAGPIPASGHAELSR